MKQCRCYWLPFLIGGMILGGWTVHRMPAPHLAEPCVCIIFVGAAFGGIACVLAYGGSLSPIRDQSPGTLSLSRGRCRSKRTIKW